MRPCPWPVDTLLPHAAPMILIDRISAFAASDIVAEVVIGPHSPFLEADGVPSHVGIEYIAQTIAALAGLRGRLQGTPPRIGFLLGTRQLTTTCGWFRRGDRLIIAVHAVFEDGEMGAFDGRIERDGEVIMTGRLNVYQPTDTIDSTSPGGGAPSSS